MKTLLKKLKKFINVNGYAKTAYMLGYRDTDVLKKWFRNEKISDKAIDNVRELLK